MKHLPSTLLAVLGAALTAPASPQCPPDPTTLMGGLNNGFGAAVDVDGETLVIGAPRLWLGVPAAVYVYESGDSGEWRLEQTLLPPVDPVVDMAFGRSVALDGDVLVVGAPEHDAGDGFVFVFERNAGGRGHWGHTATLSSGPYSLFGYSVDVRDGLLVVGAPGGLLECTTCEGFVHVFERIRGEWIEIARLAANDYAGLLGWSVVTDGSVVLAGSPVGDAHEACGSAWFFERDAGGEWVPQRVVADDSCPGGEGLFGESVSMSNGRAAIQAGGHGDVHIHERDAASGHWQKTAVVRSPSLGGEGVVLEGDQLVTHSDGGRVYRFRRTDADWTLEESLVGHSSYFGTGMALEGEQLFVGDPHFKNKATKAFGALHVFGTAGGLSPSSITSFCGSSSTPAGCQPVLSACGTPSATAASGFELVAGPLEGGRLVRLEYSVNGREIVPWNAGTSFKCIKSPAVLTSNFWSVGTQDECSGVFAMDLNEWWTGFPSSKNPGPGDRVSAQVWLDGPAYGSGTEKGGWTNAIAFTVLP